MSDFVDPYAVLGVAPNADLCTLEDAYFNCLGACDPEIHGDSPEIRARATEVFKAWEAITNPPSSSEDEDYDEDEDVDMVDLNKEEYREKLAAAFDQVELEWSEESQAHHGDNGFFVEELQRNYQLRFDQAAAAVKHSILEVTTPFLFRQDYFDEAVAELHQQREKRHAAIKRRVLLFQVAMKAKERADRFQKRLASHDALNEAERKRWVADHKRAVRVFHEHEKAWMDVRRQQVAEAKGNQLWYRYTGPDEEESFKTVKRIANRNKKRKTPHGRHRQRMRGTRKEAASSTPMPQSCTHGHSAQRTVAGSTVCNACAKSVPAFTNVHRCLDCSIIMCGECHGKLSN